MATTIKLKNGSGAPLAGDLVQGEPALDLTNKRLYTEDSGGTVIEVGTNPSTLTVDTTTLVVDAGNNRVGIGTASPTSTASAGPTLEISGTAGGNLVLSDSNATTGQRAKYLLSQGGALYVGHSADNGTSPVNDLVIDSSGNVGIGTTSPSTILELSDAQNLRFDLGTSGTNEILSVGGADNLSLRSGGSANILFKNGSSEAMRIDSSGRLLLGTTSSVSVTGGDRQFQISGTNGVTSSAVIRRSQNSSGAPSLSFAKDRGSVSTVVASGDALGAIYFAGSDGTDLTNDSAAIISYADGTPSSNNMPGVLVFSTNGGSTSSTERMRIESNGRVGIGTSSPSARLHLLDTGSQMGILASSSASTYIQFASATNTTRGYIGNGSGLVTGASNSDFIFRSQGDAVIATGGNAERMRIDSSGNVGIGTNSPGTTLTVNADPPSATYGIANFTAPVGNDAYIVVNRGSADNGGIKVQRGSNVDGAFYVTGGESVAIGYNMSDTGDALVFRNGSSNAEVARMDNSGNLLVGKTSTTITTAGTAISTSLGVRAAVNGDIGLLINRLTSDGNLVDFRKDSLTVGVVAAKDGDIALGTGDTGLRFTDASDAITPHNTDTNGGRDNVIDLGTSGARFDDIYATNATIQTSDANEKQDIEALSEAETRVAVAAKGLLRKFRWKSAVEEKGDEARIHFGIIAQDLKAAFKAEGLDAGRYAMFIHSTWTDEETGEERSRMGVRYSELLAFIIAAI